MKKSIILASLAFFYRADSSSDIAKIAAELVDFTNSEIEKLAKIVEESASVEIERKSKLHFFVPRTIGCPKKGFAQMQKIRKFKRI